MKIFLARDLRWHFATFTVCQDLSSDNKPFVHYCAFTFWTISSVFWHRTVIVTWSHTVSCPFRALISPHTFATVILVTLTLVPWLFSTHFSHQPHWASHLTSSCIQLRWTLTLIPWFLHLNLCLVRTWLMDANNPAFDNYLVPPARDTTSMSQSITSFCRRPINSMRHWLIKFLHLIALHLHQSNQRL